MSNMRFRLRFLACALTLLSLCAGYGLSKFQQPPLEKQNAKSFKQPQPLKNDQVAKDFSLDKALYALDSASLDWWQSRGKCFTCHTNVPYLYARPLFAAADPAPQDVRAQLEETVDNALKGKRRDYMSGFYATSAATALAINDAITTKKLHPLTKAALDHMWTQQKKDGTMPWGGGVEPVGSRHYGAAITVVAVTMAPEGYAETEAGKQGLDLVRTWLTKNPARVLYDKAMVLWAASHLDGILSAEEKANIVKDLREKQLADGGWSLHSLNGADQNGKGGDGYATGLTIIALRRAGVPANDPALVKGIAWLKANQLESGRWPTQSIARNNQSSVLTNTASAFAVMALHACSEPAAAPAPLKIRINN